MKKQILLLLILLLFVSVQNIFAEEPETPPGQNWDVKPQSVGISLFEVDITGSVLTISSQTPGSDMTIRISQNDVTLFEQTVPSSETGCVTIDLSNFEAGNYFLELTNQWGGYLYGSFSIE